VDIDDLPSPIDLYAGNDKARTADSIAVDFGSWLGQNQEALFSMTSAQAVGTVVEKMSEILRDHGGQNGRRFRSGDMVMYLHLENNRVCTLRDAGQEIWMYDSGQVHRCDMGHPW